MPERPLKFSLVTPSLNQGAYIRETMESVLSQEGDFEIEYFVIDGGSSDGSAEIIRQYAEMVSSGDRPARCRGITLDWVSEKDHGQSEAINKGLRRATGDYVGYLNSDDLYFPGALARAAEAFKAQPQADFIHGDGIFIDENSQLKWAWQSRPYDYQLLSTFDFFHNRFTNFIVQQATFWRKVVLDRIGFLDESFHYAMDVEYWVRAGRHGLRFHYLPVPLGKHRYIPGIKTLSSPTVFWEDYMEIFRRYRGTASLDRYFAHYYYSLALENGFDLEQVRREGLSLFARWKDLPSSEQRLLQEQSNRGFNLTRLLSARILNAHQRKPEARRLFKQALRERPGLLFNPYALPYLLSSVIGNSLAQSLEKWIKTLLKPGKRPGSTATCVSA
jgi:glycosyltransferase involved in cell wall biosynthesis